MMDTILNLGLNDRSAHGLANASGSPRFAADSYRRFVQMYADVVLGVPSDVFEEALTRAKSSRGVVSDVDLDAAALEELIQEFLRISRGHTGRDFPEDPREQLDGAITAVFGSWNTPRANVSPSRGHLRQPWHGGQHPADGLRQPRRRLGHRRRLHPRTPPPASASSTASSS